jgi:hypothetical protein
MSWQLAGICLACLLWAAWFGRLRALFRHVQDAIHQAECVTFCGAALCLTLQLPPVGESVNELLGIPNIARLLGNLAGVYAAWSFSPCMIQLWGLPTRRGSILTSTSLMRATSVFLILLFIFSPPQSNVRQYVATPFTITEQSLAYTLVYMAYLGAIVFQMLILSVRCERTVGRSPLIPRRLRYQLRLQTVGWAAGVVFALHECGYALLRQLEQPYPLLNPAAVSNMLLVGAVIGVTGGDVHAPWYWLSQYRACHRLYPLWHLLRKATPGIARRALFIPPYSSGTDALAFNDTSLRLIRRVVEVWDGIVALRPYRDRSVATQAASLCRHARLNELESKIVIEAAILSVAANAKGAGMGTPPETFADDIQALIDPDSFGEELAYLLRVSSAIQNSPIVAAIIASRQRGGGPASVIN